MKILYAIQGTGNGHISRAKEIIPHLKRHGELDILLSGFQSDLQLPFDIKYSFKGLSFVFGKGGGIDLVNTYLRNYINRFLKEVRSLPIEDYDLVINDFEPISAWAAHAKKIPCIGLSNQSTLKSLDLRGISYDDLVGRLVINYYSPTTVNYGFHYHSKSTNLFTPIIRKEIRELSLSNQGHYTVYLPSFSMKKIEKVLKEIDKVEWHVFIKGLDEKVVKGSIKFLPINEKDFLNSFSACEGIVTAAGFGTTTEAIHLGKKLLVIPQKNQFEQHCNAFFLKEIGVKVIKKFKPKNLKKIINWINSKEVVQMEYPNQTKEIIDTIMLNEYYNKDNYLDYITSTQFDLAV